jgi:pimeloyl-ACP methyl ester carboxylesterase
MNRKAFMPLAESFLNCAAHVFVDFPGFGESPAPAAAWGVPDYSRAMAEFLAPLKKGRKLIWVGHSFGGRVGMRLAIDYPDLIDGLFLVGSHGLKRKRGIFETLRMKARIYTFKTLKFLAPLTGQSLDELRAKFGSPDYRAAGAAFRPTFMKIIVDDLTADIPEIRCPARLVYGANDTETPPEMGERIARLIPGASIAILPGQDHYSVLGAGRHLVAKYLGDFLERYA